MTAKPLQYDTTKTIRRDHLQEDSSVTHSIAADEHFRPEAAKS